MVKGDTIRSRGTGSYPNLREEVARLIAGGDLMKFEAKLEELRRMQEHDKK